MEQILEQLKSKAGKVAEHGRVDAMIESLTSEPGSAESLADLAHDARNMVAALSVYCDLLEEPGVLAYPFAHYGSELRLVTAASRRLVEKMMLLNAQGKQDGASTAAGEREREPATWTAANVQVSRRQGAVSGDSMPAVPVANLAEELLANRNLLAALAGPSIAVTVETEGGTKAVRVTGEDLTRVLVNLVKNAAEAMSTGGRIRIALSERPARAGKATRLVIAVEDNGPGIPEKMLEQIFTQGYTTRASNAVQGGAWPTSHRGLGLAISRSIVEAAGGRLTAVRNGAPGARVEMELPVQGEGAYSDKEWKEPFVVS